jgi:hypothetical protein
MKKKWIISFVFTLIVFIGLSFWNHKNRVYDWDMPGYIGCLYSQYYPNNPEKVHRLTYESIKNESSDYFYKDIIGLDLWDTTRQSFTNNTQSFIEQLPYFYIKVGYNWAIMALYTVGVSAPNSILYLSLLSYFLSGLLIFYLMYIIFPKKYIIASIVSIGVLLLPPMTYMSRVSTPDMFIVIFLLIFMIGWIKKWSSWALFVVLFLITLVRPDYVPFTLSYLGISFLIETYKTKKINLILIIQGIILLSMYFWIIKYYNYPGWKHLFYDTFIHRRPFISKESPDFTINEYLKLVLFKLSKFKKVTLVSVILVSVTFFNTKDFRTRTMFIFILVNLYIKFFFFPQSASLRFFFPYILLMLIVCIYSFKLKNKSLKNNLNLHNI